MKKRLKQARKAAGMTQKEVAERLGITESTYCGYETGKRQPDAVKISAIARVLGVSGDYLLGLEEGQPPLSTETEQERELLLLFRDMSDDGKAALLVAARAIK